MHDLQYAIRLLQRRPAFTLIIVLTLAVGIGANTAIFSLVNTVLLRGQPYPDADRLVMVREQRLERGDYSIPVAPANFFDWKDRVTAFESVAWSRDGIFNLTGDGDPESIMGYRFSANMFDVLGLHPMLGRGFLPDDDRPGGPRVAVLSHKLWQRRYAGDPGVLGRSITLNGDPFTVIGVMPPEFRHPQGTELWIPIALPSDVAARRDATILRLVARLKPGRTIDQAQRELEHIYRELAGRHPQTNTGLTPQLTRLGDPGDARPLLAVLFGAVGFVLLIACANVANLLLADAASRRQELALRAALGASRGRVMRQVLTESLVLAGIAGALGAVFTWWSADALVALFPQTISNLDLPRVEEIDVDATVMLFALAVSLATAATFGVLPAARAAGTDLQEALKNAVRTASGHGSKTHAVLIIAEVALSLVLLVGATLLVRSFMRLQQGQLGFVPDRVVSARLMLPQYKYRDADRIRAFTQSLTDRLRALPDVEAVGVTNYLPLSGWWGVVTFRPEGQAEAQPGQEPMADYRTANDDYFRAMGIRLLAGRAFTDRDTETAPQVVIVNDTLAKRYWAGQNPLGKRMYTDGGRDSWEIVGVVADVKSFGLEEETHAELFRPVRQEPSPLLGLALLARGDPAALGTAIRQAVWSIDRDQPVTHLITMRELAAESMAFRRVGMTLAGGFALLALALSAVGIYGVISYAVSRRTREIGVRMALGATRREIAGLVIRQGLWMTSTGVAIGIVAALVLTQYLSTLLFRIEPWDFATFTVVTVVLVLVALAATYLPARRATRLDPIAALRAE